MKLFNSQTKKLVSLETISPDKKISFYSCGPTVYDYPHLGNWYAFLRWDLLVRCLEVAGYEVSWVMNITDVGHLTSDADEGEDKLALAGQKSRQTAWQVATFYGDYFKEGLTRLNFRKPDQLPRATDFIKEQISFVEGLLDLGLAYQIDDGIYYDTAKWPNYGQWRQGIIEKPPESLDLARIEPNPQKKHPSDFALWKFSPKKAKRDMEWPSPWGVGFPGWHLECSVMCHHYFKETVTIHAGGIDHIPIHHTNEIATSEALFKKPLAKIWLHSNFVLIDKEKMSKSLNNCYLLEDVLKKGFSLVEFRLAVLSSGYRHQADFSWAIMPAAVSRYESLLALAALVYQGVAADSITVEKSQQRALKAQKDLKNALFEDLNSPAALAALDVFAKKVLTGPWPTGALEELKELVALIDRFFGLKLATTVVDLTARQKEVLKDRQAARQAGDYTKSDQLRQELDNQGVLVLDLADNCQIWRPKRENLKKDQRLD